MTMPKFIPDKVKKLPVAQKKIGVCLHASAVNVSGKAILFLGHSTAGKSTISQLLSERYPVIADDKVWVSRHKSGLMVCDGSNNFLTEEIRVNSFASQAQYPLLAILRIFKSKKIKIKPVSPKQICRYLIDAVFEVDIQRNQEDLRTIKRWFALVVEISKKNEGWHLTFIKDKSIIKLVYENFEERFLKGHAEKFSRLPKEIK